MRFTEIESNIPFPKGTKPGKKAKYPFVDMNVGDSVFFEGARSGGKEYLAAMAVSRSHKKKFSGRSVDGGLRIWRIE